MTAEQIRKAMGLLEKTPEAIAMFEIAAQLAELNKTLFTILEVMEARSGLSKERVQTHLGGSQLGAKPEGWKK